MRETIPNQIQNLKDMDISKIQALYKELYGKESNGTHKTYLWRKVAYKLQEQEYGSLSAKAKEKLQALIEEYDPVNNKVLRPDKAIISQQLPIKDKRLPILGTVITKGYKGLNYQVKVLEKGFEYNQKIYKTLSAIAKEITGAHWNGYLFFNL